MSLPVSTLLAVQGLAVRSTHASLLRDVDFTLEPGQALAVLGESGAGKSLLAQAVMGTLPLELAARGRIEIGGRASQADDPGARRPLWGRTIALLPQEPASALDPTMRALPQLAEVHRLVRRDAASAQDARLRAMATLEDAGLAHAAGRYPWQLSGGMAQRLAFAVAVAGGAPLLLVDEPTKGLDAARRAEVVDALRAVLARGGAVLAITHDLRLARALGGRALVLQAGEVVEQGDTAELLAQPRHTFTRRLVAADPAGWPARRGAAHEGDANGASGSSGSGGPDDAGGLAPNDSGRGATVVRGRGLSKRHGEQRLFHGIDIELKRGDRLVVRGPSGVGKTTLGNALLGLAPLDEGQVVRAAGLRPVDLQKLYQEPVSAFAPRVTLAQSLRDLCVRHGLPWRRVEERLAQLGLPSGLLQRRPRQVSGGELQRVALLRALLLSPALIFADEPTSRLDPVTQHETLALLLDECERHRMALLLVTHDDDIARHVATRLLELRPAGAPGSA